MPIIRAQTVAVRLDGQVDDLFRDVSFEINPRDRVGLIGPNGCGKTTLLRVLAGELHPASGDVIRPKSWNAPGYLRQQSTSARDWPVLDEVLSAFPGVADLKGRLVRLEAQMRTLSGAALDRTVIEYGEVLDTFHRERGYEIEREAVEALLGLGFTAEVLSLPVGHLSSGQRTRAELARLLIQPSDLLLLDEPTNHLDIDGQDWLERYLERYAGAVVIVSHDRYFLDRTVSRILELRRGRLREYTGNYTFYAGQRRLEEERAWEEYERAGKEEKRLRAALTERRRVARKVQGKPKSRTYDPKQADFYAHKAAKVMKRAKVLERRVELQIEQQQQTKPFIEKQTALSFPSVTATSGVVVHATGLTKGFGQKILFADAAFYITGGQRVAVIGRNGAGKTTLLRVLLGHLPPDTGEVRFGRRVQVGYYGQEQEGLNTDRTILEEAMSAGSVDETWARTVLGALLLRRDKVHDRVRTLSLGEKGRVMLAKLLLSGANCLVLDEPTNHLDIDAREAVEGALAEYPGTVLFVSHDRRLIERLADAIITVADGQARYYPGTYEEYVEKREMMA
ncbi:MAG: ABC-F type ribosomal protection protein [Candidatus Latescibacteria bacterium]|nr:ABC-F type ribosomal protection protein [Candidatus Latescibacterota bacterium]